MTTKKNRPTGIPCHKSVEPNVALRGKVAIGVCARLDAFMEARSIRFPGEVMSKALDAYLKAEGF